MKEPEPLDGLIGEDLPAEERARLERVDALLRSVPGPLPQLPASLARAVDRIGLERPHPARRRLALAAVLAGAAIAAAFGFGRWTAGEEFDARAVVAMQATEEAPEAAAVIEIGERDESSGNWKLQVELSGLPTLPPGQSYHLWLAKDGQYAASCGSFNVGEGTTRVELTVAYRLREYDAWVITESGDGKPWLLEAEVRA